jgi:hypothetical protein
VATVGGDTEIVVAGSGAESAAVTLTIGAGIARDTEITDATSSLLATNGNGGWLSNCVDLIPGQNITIVTNANKRTFTINGFAGNWSVTNIATSMTVGTNKAFVVVDSSGGTVTVTLPTPAPEGFFLMIKRIGVYKVLIDAPAGERIDGEVQQDLAVNYAARNLLHNGTNWLNY